MYAHISTYVYTPRPASTNTHSLSHASNVYFSYQPLLPYQAFETRLDKYWSALRETPVKSIADDLTGDLTEAVGDDLTGDVPSQPLTRLSHNVLVEAQNRVRYP